VGQSRSPPTPRGGCRRQPFLDRVGVQLGIAQLLEQVRALEAHYEPQVLAGQKRAAGSQARAVAVELAVAPHHETVVSADRVERVRPDSPQPGPHFAVVEPGSHAEGRVGLATLAREQPNELGA
jgi:hypothetical protein